MSLKVLVDGVPLANDEEAKLIWERFSAWMEEHKGDLGGFAKAEGFASARPGVESGRPTLFLSRSAPQGPYEPAREEIVHNPPASAHPKREVGGSDGRHEPRDTNRSRGRPTRRNRRK